MSTQDGDPELQPSIQDMDYTQGHIVMLLASQTNDQERYVLTEKIILELVTRTKDYSRKDKTYLRQWTLSSKDCLTSTRSKHLLETNKQTWLDPDCITKKFTTHLNSVGGRKSDEDLKDKVNTVRY